MATATASEIDTTFYPESDGQPMAETEHHYDAIVDFRERLKEWLADDAHLSGNLFVYYVKGQPTKVLAPDVFVVFGVPKRRRRVFKTWEEGATPSVVFEFTSASTSREDLREKVTIYQDVWKVKEYFLFDPLDEYLDPPLLGYRLAKGKFQPIRMVKGKLASKELGTTIERDGTELILRDAKSGERLVLPAEKRADEERTARLRAEAALDRAVAGRTQADAEIARLKAELDALRKKKS